MPKSGTSNGNKGSRFGVGVVEPAHVLLDLPIPKTPK
jgi:hypothetical protein